VRGLLDEIAKPELLKSTAETGLFLESEMQRLSARRGARPWRAAGTRPDLPTGAAIVAQAFELGGASELAAARHAALHAGPHRRARRSQTDDQAPGAILIKAGVTRLVA